MHWFARVVFRWRTVAASSWLMVGGGATILLLCQLLATHNLLHPIAWAYVCVQRICSVWSLLLSGAFLSFLTISFLINSSCYTVVLPVYKSRLSVLCSVLKPSHLTAALLLALLGAGESHCLYRLLAMGEDHPLHPSPSPSPPPSPHPPPLHQHSHGLWEPCESHQRCLNEKLLFSMLHGFFLGLCIGVHYFVSKEFFLAFPSIQQPKLFRLRGHVWSHLWEGLRWSLWSLCYFYPAFFLLGSYPRNLLTQLFDLHLRHGDSGAVVHLSSLAGLMDAVLLLQVALLGAVQHTLWALGLRLFRIFHTEAVRFPVVATFSGETPRLLVTALNAKNTPLLNYLGYLDLYQLSLHSVQRRKQVYSLDQSGQPAVWRDISKASLELISSMVTRLGGDLSVPTSTPLPPPSSSSYSLSSPATSTSRGWPEVPRPSPPVVTRRHMYDEQARLWTHCPQGVQAALGPKPPQPRQSVASILLSKAKGLLLKLSQLPHTAAQSLKRKPFFAYFLSELPDTHNQELFRDCRLQVWAVSSLSELAASSYAEDTYGVVQRTLPSIFTTLITLSQALDKHVKVPLSSSKSTRNVRVALETNGKYAVKAAVQTALHRLGTTFSKELRSLHLCDEHLFYLKMVCFSVPLKETR